MRAYDFPNPELSIRLTVLGMISNGTCLKFNQNTVGVGYPITVMPVSPEATKADIATYYHSWVRLFITLLQQHTSYPRALQMSASREKVSSSVST